MPLDTLPNELQELIMEKCAEIRAATRIQATWRGFFSRMNIAASPSIHDDDFAYVYPPYTDFLGDYDNLIEARNDIKDIKTWVQNGKRGYS